MLNPKEIFLLAALMCFLSFLVLFSFKGHGVAGIRQILLGSVLGMMGNGLYAFGKELPPLFAFELANLTYTGAMAAVFVGYRKLFKRPTYTWAVMFALAIFTGLMAYFHYGTNSFAARTVVASLFHASMGFGIGLTVLQSRSSWRRPFYPKIFILTVSGLITMGHLTRVVHQMLNLSAPKSLLEPSESNALILAAGVFILPALAFGAMQLAHRRIMLEVENAANYDHLTGVLSRRAFYEIGERELVRALRTDRPLSMLLVDLDNFKPINDTYGHDAGDRALELFVQRARLELRSIDYLSRMGGDEFAVLLPETTLTGAEVVAMRLKQSVESDCRPDFMAGVTLSIGVTSVSAGDNLKSVVKRADVALYAAKAQGRNRVALHDPELTAPGAVRLVASN